MKPETVEGSGKEILTPETEVVSDLTLNEDKVQALINLANRSEELGKALDQLRAFALKRTLPGDFIAFKEQGSDEEVLSLTGAACDRIAAPLGFSFKNWTSWKDTFTDNIGPGYNWWYSCTAMFGGRELYVEGRTGTRDKFFGRQGGSWKQLEDIPESDIRTAARRSCMKEGVTVMLGLRRIPKKAAEAMGIDLGKVRSVSFTSSSGGKDSGKKLEIEVKIVKVGQKTVANDKKVYVIKIEHKDHKTVETWSQTLAEAAKKQEGKRARIKIETTRYSPKLLSVEPLGEEEPKA